MSRFRASHRTEISYAGDARESVNHVRLLPAGSEIQKVLEAEVRVWPDTAIREFIDAFGNRVTWFHVHDVHRRLVIEATATVELGEPVRAVTASNPSVSMSELDDPGYRDEHAEFLHESPYVRLNGPVAEFGDELVLPADGVREWLTELEAQIHSEIVYTTGATGVETPIERVVEIRRGVCQDMAHLFIALARRRGIATRYLSGWLHIRDHSEPAESHAWVEANIPGSGWIQFDPTHPGPYLNDYIRVARGRDYADAAPVRGSYLGDPPMDQKITVEVRLDNGADDPD